MEKKKVSLPIIVNDKDYAKFNYDPFYREVEGQAQMGYNENPYDVEPPFRVGEVVYIKSERALGVVLGTIDIDGGELRTDMSGMVAFNNMESFDPAKHKRAFATTQLESELLKMGIKLGPVNQDPFHITIAQEGVGKSDKKITEVSDDGKIYIKVNNLDIRIRQMSNGSGLTIIVTDAATCMQELGKLTVFYSDVEDLEVSK